MICKECGKYKKVKPHREATAKYCSQECHNIGAMKKNLPCPQCGKIHNRSKQGLCPACALKKWYKTCDKKSLFKKIYDYNKKNRDKRIKWQTNWAIKAGVRPPRELQELRRAYKFLEKAVGKAK